MNTPELDELTRTPGVHHHIIVHVANRVMIGADLDTTIYHRPHADAQGATVSEAAEMLLQFLPDLRRDCGKMERTTYEMPPAGLASSEGWHRRS